MGAELIILFYYYAAAESGGGPTALTRTRLRLSLSV